MAVITRHRSCTARFDNEAGERVQSLSQIRPNITGSDLGSLREIFNNIRVTQDPIVGGLLTITTELRQE